MSWSQIEMPHMQTWVPTCVPLAGAQIHAELHRDVFTTEIDLQQKEEKGQHMNMNTNSHQNFSLKLYLKSYKEQIC